MGIRPAQAGDGIGIGLVHVRSWQAAYRGLLPQGHLDGLDPGRRGDAWERYLDEDRRPGESLLVAEAGGAVVGFANVGRSRDEDADGDGEVRAIYLLADRWGQGIGRDLMTIALRALRDAAFTRAALWVLDTNDRATRFYRAGGWAPDGA